MFARIAILISVVTSLAVAAPAQAGISLNATRVIYDASKKHANVTVQNPTKQVYAVQAWINTAKDDTTTRTPFIVMPALFRVAPQKEQSLQITKVTDDIPRDRESVFYLNAQEIPVASSSDDNVLRIALRTRIKVFYRPVGLAGTPTETPAKLQFFTALGPNGSRVLMVRNPTAFHVSFTGVQLRQDGKTVRVENPPMATPFSDVHLPLSSPPGASQGEVSFAYINDFGGASALVKAPVAQR